MMRIGSIAATLPPLLLALVLGCDESFRGVGAAALGAEAGEPAGGAGDALGVTGGTGSGGVASVAGSESVGAGVAAGSASTGGMGGIAGHATAGGMAPQAGAAAGGPGGSPTAGGTGGVGNVAQAGGAAGSGGTAPECAILKTKSDCAGCEISFERCGAPPAAAQWLTSASSGLAFECAVASPLDCTDAEERAKFWMANECCTANGGAP